ncbi:MobF family relaxase, partial [Herbaspirillum sp. B65]|uniref:MobF family relaxase n=1 Tax=Herbaspirillum sp. B65 TaxID=137708 RepID=UPI0005CA5A0E
MLSIAKINSAYNQVKHSATTKGGYLFYLQSSGTRQRTDFLDYLSPDHSVPEPQAFWAGRGTDDFALSDTVELDQVEKLAWGYSPSDGKPLVRGAGAAHVMGIDMTFSAPKDVSAVFAAAHPATQSAINDCMQKAVQSALDYTESISVTRHGAGGRIKKKVSSIIAACYPHFASRALQPQLHVHAFLFNLGKRSGSKEWSALDNKAQFDHKMVTGMLFRVDLAYQLARLGFQIMPDGQYFQIKGVSEHQRQTLSKRRAEIQAFMAAHDGRTALDADIAALNTRSAKAEPPYLELLGQFRDMTAELGLTAE